jgi:hypothetical protein
MFFGSFKGKICSGKYFVLMLKHMHKKQEERDIDVREHSLGTLQVEYLCGYRDHNAPFWLGIVLLGCEVRRPNQLFSCSLWCHISVFT